MAFRDSPTAPVVAKPHGRDGHHDIIKALDKIPALFHILKKQGRQNYKHQTKTSNKHNLIV